jgi:hypothetical protein
LVIFRDVESFNRIRQASPITFELERKSIASPFQDLSQNSQQRSLNSLNIEDGTILAEGRQGTVNEFKVTVEPWEGNHGNYLQQTPLWGQFKITPNIIQRDLERQVPMLGLSDVHVTRKPPPYDILRRWAEKIGQRKTLRQMHEESSFGNKTEEDK